MKFCGAAAVCLVLSASTLSAAELPKPFLTGLKNPESAAVGPDRAVYVTEIGEFDKDGDGQVTVIRDGKATPFAAGLNDPKGIAFHAAGNAFYVTDKNRLLKIDLRGQVTTAVEADKFPSPPKFLNDVAIDQEGRGRIYVSDSGDFKGSGGAVFRLDLQSGGVETVVDAKKIEGLHTPNGLALDGQSQLLVLDFGTGFLHRIRLTDGSAHKVAEGFKGGDGLVWDKFGRLFISSNPEGKIWGIPRPGQKAILLSEGWEGPADFCLDATGKNLVVPSMKTGTLTNFPTTIPGWEVDDSPLPLKTEVAFSKLEWTSWQSDIDGRPNPLRPILLTHPGDGTNRIVVPSQQGVIHVFPNDDGATKTNVFLDLTSKIRYSDRANEEGLLGLAFHPKYKENGEFFIFYTDVTSPLPPRGNSEATGANVVVRFRVSKDDPNKADPTYSEEIIRFKKKFFNHDGGTIAFGPDGYLYITHGDGGAANDPDENGQNLNSILGKVLRLDVDHKADGKNYAIPKDNPFVGKTGMRPEIWAYGVRNLWRMSFDRKTGELWAGEVGQNLFEEIIIVKSGGNYGWSIRESLHPFGAKGVDVRADLIEPIWEYHHDVGKSITGGHVYRGTKFPELEGTYIYGDYVSGRMFSLKYDAAKGRVVANREIQHLPPQPMLSYGEDEKGEVYALIVSGNGRGIYRFAKSN